MRNKFIVSLIVTFVLALIPLSVRAYTSGSVEILPSTGLIVPGKLNLTNTGFRVNISSDTPYTHDSLALFLDQCADPIDSETIDDGHEYILSSGTNSLLELQNLLASCSPTIEGSHRLTVKGISGSNSEIIHQDELVADFILPENGVFSVEEPDDEVFKVSDKITLNYALNDPDDITISSKIYGRNLTWSKLDNLNYRAEYIVREGDPDLTGSLAIESVSITDDAGNQRQLGKIDIPALISIDGHSPSLRLISPDAKTYGPGEIDIKYQTDADVIKVLLDGIVINKIQLTGLSHGSHTIEVIAEDLAGNRKAVSQTFNIDLIPPQVLTDELPSEIVEGDTLAIRGTTEVGSGIKIELDGEIAVLPVSAKGEFNFEIKNLGVGTHKIYLIANDNYGNTKKILLCSVLVLAKPLEKEPVKVAEADVRRDYEEPNYIEKPIKQVQSEPQEVAKTGRIVSSEDTNPKPLSYMPWLLLIGLLVLSIAIASAGYYGFAWIKLSREDQGFEQAVEKEVFKETSETIITESITEEKISNDEEDENHLRW